MKTLLFCIFTFAMLSLHAQNTRHIGTWKGIDDNETIYLTFQKDGFVVLNVQGMTLGGKEFEIKGKKMSTPYEIEYTSGAPRFTIFLKELETNTTQSRMTGTINFRENNSAYICMREFNDDEAPVKFEEDDCLTFTKTD